MGKKEMTKEIMQEKIKIFADCKTAEEVLTVARAQNLSLTPEQASEILQVLSGELSNEVLEKVVGGFSCVIGFYT